MAKQRTKKSAVVAGGLAAALLISGALAYFSDSDTDVNRFSFADKDGEQTVDVELVEPNWDPEAGKNMLPGDTVAKDPMIANEGENDVYGFITVLVPTAKSINLHTAGGKEYEAEDVELFKYDVRDGWKEVDVTKKEAANAEGDKLATAKSITNKADDDNNIYYTAHTYAFSGDDGMTRLAAGQTTTSLFDKMTDLDGEPLTEDDADVGGIRMINIANGEQKEMSIADVIARDSVGAPEGIRFVESEGKIVKETDSFYASESDYIDAYKAAHEGATPVSGSYELDAEKGYVVDKETGKGIVASTASKTVYTTVTEGEDDDAKTWVIDENGNKQWKSMSQIKTTDNINVYVTSYAIQADNLGDGVEDDIDKTWAVCANASADVAEGETLQNDFYFAPIAADPGAKGTAVLGE